MLYVEDLYLQCMCDQLNRTLLIQVSLTHPVTFQKLYDLLYSSHLRKPISWHLQPLPNMKNVSAATSSNNMSSSYHSRVEGIVLCSVLLLEAVLISVENLLTFVVFTSEKTLRKKSHLLVINMAFAHTILGAVAMPLYVFLWIGPTFWIWN